MALHHWRDGVGPAVHDAVALQTICGETLCLMIWRFRFLEVVEMTTDTLSRETLPVEGSYGPHFVTGIAIDGGMGTD